MFLNVKFFGLCFTVFADIGSYVHFPLFALSSGSLPNDRQNWQLAW